MALSQRALLDLVGKEMWPCYRKEREKLDRIDRWYRWEHDKPFRPRQATREADELARRAQTPWLGLVVTSVAQALYVEGYRQAKANDDAPAWNLWQANGLDARQIAVHRATLGYGLSYVTVLPGTSFTGDALPAIRGVSPRRMVTFYEDETENDWPSYALRVDPAKIGSSRGYNLRVLDDQNVYYLTCGADGGGLMYLEDRKHDVGVCPVVRFTNVLDLEGRADGEVEPFIPLAARIDQTIFDRLVVQRYASWVVRTVSGMAKPENTAQTDQTTEAAKMRLSVEDILVAEDPDTKFGSLPATPLEGFISAVENDIRQLAAVTQTPAHEMLGQMANLSAEALAAAEASLMRKVDERQHTFGEGWEQVLRLAAFVSGDAAGAGDVTAQVRWRDTESRSLAQTADALGKLAQMLMVPVEMLWEKIPGWTQQDVERAKALAHQGGAMDALMRELVAAQTGAPPPPPPPPGPAGA